MKNHILAPANCRCEFRKGPRSHRRGSTARLLYSTVVYYHHFLGAFICRSNPRSSWSRQRDVTIFLRGSLIFSLGFSLWSRSLRWPI